MIMSDLHKFMFFHPSRKTGGTSVAVALSDVARDPFKDRHLRPSHAMNREPVKFAKYYKFAFVRNPWDRLVSCYAYDNQVTNEFQKGGKFHGIGFSDYLSQRLLNDKEHWRCPQGDYLKIDGKWIADFIGRFETIQSDFDLICKSVGLPVIKLPQKRKTVHGNYREYYDGKSKALVSSIFARDIEDFEYEF